MEIMNDKNLIEIELSELIFDETIYPRKNHNHEKVQEYADNMDSIEQLENYIDISKNKKILDGKHRWLAYQKLADDKPKKIKVYQWDIEDTKDEYVKAIELNSSHGQQLTVEEKRQNCQTLYSQYGYTLETICNIVKVSKSVASKATENIRKYEKQKQNEKIFNMWLQCYTQQQIADEMEITQPTIKTKIDSFIKKVPSYFSYNTLPFFDEKNEKGEFLFDMPIYNVWTFGKKTNKGKHFGNSEQRILENLLYLYTEPFDIVIDCFAGGGSSLDVCKKRLRRIWLSDRKPIVEREEEIRKLDIVQELPNLDKRWSDVSLTYLDPPYWRQAQNKYSNDESDLANMSLENFTKTMVKLIKDIAKKQSKGAIAMLMQPTQWNADNREFTDHIQDIAQGVNSKNLIIENRVSCPYSTEQYNEQQVIWSKEHKKLLVISRELIIWRIVND